VTAWDPLQASANYWSWASRVGEIALTRLGGRAAIDAARRRRVADILRFARERSPYYRAAYRALPEVLPDLGCVPRVTKRALMARFDDWVTDPEVTKSGVEAFLADRTHIGERYLGRYVVWKSSGSTGEPGIYVQDADALTTFDALMAAHVEPVGFAAQHAWDFLVRGGRAALVVATGDHFASIASWQRLCESSPAISARGFSILEPLPSLVAALNEYRPAFLASYPTMLSLLADEQREGRLRLALSRVWSGGECLAAATLAGIERAFDCPVVNEYGASECMSIAFGCAEGWLHVNADWVVLEPVDADGRPAPPGEPSRTALLTNLANRVQPIIRYDLGDSVLASPEPCRCGSPLPAIRVEGRRDDVVALVAPDGRIVRLLPLALTTIVEGAANVHRFQIVQTAPDRLSLRLAPAQDDRRATWLAISRALREYLGQQSLPNVEVALDRRPPSVDARSGKLREVVAGDTVVVPQPKFQAEA
jgi:phenylacetate-CoA ligase